MDQTFFIILLANIVTLLITILVFISVFHSVTNENKKLKKELEEMKTHGYDQSHTILDSAQKEALSIISHAKDESATFHSQVQHIEAQQEHHIQEQYQAISGTYLKSFQDAMQAMNQESINLFNNISKQMHTDTDSHLAAFRQQLVTQTAKEQEDLQKKMDQEYAVVEQTVEAYKKDHLKKLDDSIYVVLNLVAQDVFGHMLKLEEHEELILRALAKFKKEQHLDQS